MPAPARRPRPSSVACGRARIVRRAHPHGLATRRRCRPLVPGCRCRAAAATAAAALPDAELPLLRRTRVRVGGNPCLGDTGAGSRARRGGPSTSRSATTPAVGSASTSRSFASAISGRGLRPPSGRLGVAFVLGARCSGYEEDERWDCLLNPLSAASTTRASATRWRARRLWRLVSRSGMARARRRHGSGRRARGRRFFARGRRGGPSGRSLRGSVRLSLRAV